MGLRWGDGETCVCWRKVITAKPTEYRLMPGEGRRALDASSYCGWLCCIPLSWTLPGNEDTDAREGDKGNKGPTAQEAAGS